MVERISGIYDMVDDIPMFSSSRDFGTRNNVICTHVKIIVVVFMLLIFSASWLLIQVLTSILK